MHQEGNIMRDINLLRKESNKENAIDSIFRMFNPGLNIDLDSLNIAFNDKGNIIYNKQKTILKRVSSLRDSERGSYIIPNNIEVIGYRSFEDRLIKSIRLIDKKIEKFAFLRANIEELHLYNSYTDVASFMEATIKDVFFNCNNMMNDAFCCSFIWGKLELPSTLTSIGRRAFENAGLTSRVIDLSGMDDLNLIGKGAFNISEDSEMVYIIAPPNPECWELGYFNSSSKVKIVDLNYAGEETDFYSSKGLELATVEEALRSKIIPESFHEYVRIHDLCYGEEV